MSEQPPDVNERLARLELIVELVPDVVKSTRASLRVLGDMAEAVDTLAEVRPRLRRGWPRWPPG